MHPTNTIFIPDDKIYFLLRFVTYDDTIKNVIFNDPATIVYWKDGTKTVVKCGENDTFDKEKGLAMAICKKMLGNRSRYNEIFKKWCKNIDD